MSGLRDTFKTINKFGQSDPYWKDVSLPEWFKYILYIFFGVIITFFPFLILSIIYNDISVIGVYALLTGVPLFFVLIITLIYCFPKLIENYYFVKKSYKIKFDYLLDNKKYKTQKIEYLNELIDSMKKQIFSIMLIEILFLIVIFFIFPQFLIYFLVINLVFFMVSFYDSYYKFTELNKIKKRVTKF